MIIDTLKSRASGSFAAKDKDKNDLKIACLLVRLPCYPSDFQETPY